MYNITTMTVTIANGASLSGATDLADYLLVGVIMPSAWTAANLTFQSSDKLDGTYNNVHDSAGVEITVTAAASRHIVLDPALLAGAVGLKVRSGTSGTPVNQGAARNLTLVLRRP